MNSDTHSLTLSDTLREVLVDFGFAPVTGGPDAGHALHRDHRPSVEVCPCEYGISIETLSWDFGGDPCRTVESAPLAWSTEPHIFRSFLHHLTSHGLPTAQAYNYNLLVSALSDEGFAINREEHHHIAIVAEGPDDLVVKDCLYARDGVVTRGIGLYWDSPVDGLVTILRPSSYWMESPGAFTTVVKHLFPVYLALQNKQTA